MLLLKNIAKNKGTIEADYYPENGKVFGHIVLNALTGAVLTLSEPTNFDGLQSMYSSHAVFALKKMALEDSALKEYRVMWY